LKFLIAGAGAIGGYLGAKMTQAGLDVTLFARGPHLAAMQRSGLRVVSAEGTFEVQPKTIASLKEADPPDVIILGVKAHGLTVLAPELAPLIGKHTTVISTQNGVPWWFFEFNEPRIRLERVDPGGVIAGAIPASAVVGSLAYFSTDILEPGVIRHTDGDRLTLGEPDGSRSDRVRDIAACLVKSGIRCPVTTRLRHEIFVKLLGNVAFNPISALTRAAMVEMIQDPGVCALIRDIMAEVEAVAHKLDMELPVSIEQRIRGAEKMGRHKTSMLQDLEAGRPMELEPIVGATLDLGDRFGVPMPYTRSIYECARLLDQLARRPQA
jgi:2-dehydropantoate 2-reductase